MTIDLMGFGFLAILTIQIAVLFYTKKAQASLTYWIDSHLELKTMVESQQLFISQLSKGYFAMNDVVQVLKDGLDKQGEFVLQNSKNNVEVINQLKALKPECWQIIEHTAALPQLSS